MTAVYKRELRSYFNSMIGYVFIAVVAVFTGLYFALINLLSGFPYFAAALSSTVVIFVFAVPVLTMKSMAEERKMKTDQMLLTYPVSTTGIIMGKYLAMMTVFVVPMLIGCLFPIVINMAGSGSYLIDYSAIFSFICLGCLFVAVGMFISAQTESQIIAAVGSMGVILVMYLWDSLIARIPETTIAGIVGFAAIGAILVLFIYAGTKSSGIALCSAGVFAVAVAVIYIIFGSNINTALKDFLGLFSIYTVINNFGSYYVFDLRGVLYLLSMSGLFVFLTIQSVQKRRWN